MRPSISYKLIVLNIRIPDIKTCYTCRVKCTTKLFKINTILHCMHKTQKTICNLAFSFSVYTSSYSFNIKQHNLMPLKFRPWKRKGLSQKLLAKKLSAVRFFFFVILYRKLAIYTRYAIFIFLFHFLFLKQKWLFSINKNSTSRWFKLPRTIKRREKERNNKKYK